MKPKHGRTYDPANFIMTMDGIGLYKIVIYRDGQQWSVTAVYGTGQDETIGAFWYTQTAPEFFQDRCEMIPESVKQWTRAYLALIQ